MKTRYSTFDITRILGIPRERLKDWMNAGFIQPTEPAHGKGTKAGFSLLDIYGISLFQELINKGFKREIASNFVRGFIHEGIEAFAYAMFKETEKGKLDVEIFSPGQYGLSFGDKSTDGEKGTPMELGNDWKHILMVNLQDLREKVNRQITREG